MDTNTYEKDFSYEGLVLVDLVWDILFGLLLSHIFMLCKASAIRV